MDYKCYIVKYSHSYLLIYNILYSKLVVTKLDRFARTTADEINTI